MKRGMNNRGQQIFGLSFGVIFAIFLIIVFIAVAFFVIWPIIGIGKCADIGFFYKDFQKAVDGAWASQSYDADYSLKIESVERICFANMSAPITNEEDFSKIGGFDQQSNIFLIPPENACGMSSNFIKHLDIASITENRNPYCVDVSRTLRIRKDFYDKMVSVNDGSLANNKNSGRIDANSGGIINVKSDICQQAEDEDTCNWLDIGFEEGYKQGCCNEHKLCC